MAHRTFKAGRRIAAAFDIYGATEPRAGGPQVSVAYTLKRADGKVVAGAPPQPLEPNARGQFSVLVGITLPAGSSGDHERSLSIRDETAVRVIEHIEPIVIEP